MSTKKRFITSIFEYEITIKNSESKVLLFAVQKPLSLQSMSKEKHHKIVVGIASFPIHFYRYVISPLTPAMCRHVPTCSEYSLHALKEHGLMKGGVMSANRILRCHPWGTSGYDPVPKYLFPVFLKSEIKSDRLKPEEQ
jgi:putative membrane protein insertion efficiency factor